MKKIIFAIFAHPDDESFGPSGTLLLESRAGTDIHLITLTNGAAGMNPDRHPNLGEIRLEEWHTAGRLIGMKTMHHLGYKDGELNNQAMIEVAQRIITLVTDITATEQDDVQIEFMTNDLNGITGHIDHIVAARAACYVYCFLNTQDHRYKRIRLACLPLQEMPDKNIDWLYMEPGRLPHEINETIDARSVRDEIIAIIRAHHTQREDGEAHIEKRAEHLGIDSFIIK